MKHLKTFENYQIETQNESLKSVILGALMTLSTLAHGQDLLNPANPISPLNPSNQSPSKEEIEFNQLREDILAEINSIRLDDSNLIKMKTELSKDIHNIDVDKVIGELKSYCLTNNLTDLSEVMDTLSKVDISKLKRGSEQRDRLVVMISDLKKMAELDKNSNIINWIIIGLIILLILVMVGTMVYLRRS